MFKPVRSSISALIASGLLAASAALWAADPMPPDNKTTGAAVIPGTGAATQPSLSPEAKDFIAKAAKGNMGEILLGEMAVQRSSSEEVRQFGKQLATDHQQANRRLVPIAAANDVPWPPEMKESDQQVTNKLRDLSGKSFDEKIVQEAIKDHEKDIKTYQEMAAKVEDEQLRQYIQMTLPVLEKHLEQARALAESSNQASR